MSTSQQGGFLWFALCVRTNHERVVSALLRSKGYEELLPLYRSRRRWSDRIKNTELPLFPGYVFSRFDINKRLPILTTPGVQSIVGNGRTPVPVEEWEIENLRLIAGSHLQAEPAPYLTVGQKVRIEHGALEGLEGILVALKKPCRLIVSVTLLRRSVSLEVDETCVRPAGTGREACFHVA
jgi:transcription antitermination factor NusG